MHVEYTSVKLRGSKYVGDLVRFIKAGAELTLAREPDNPYGSNAVLVLGVVSSEGAEPVPLGHLPKGVASRVARDMDAGRTFHVIYAGGAAQDFTPYLVLLTTEDGEELKLTRLKHR